MSREKDQLRMKVVEIRHPYKKSEIYKDDIALVLGFFDGVHRGHQEVIKRGREEADKRGLKLAVMTFNQHPSIVFQKVAPESIKYLTTVEQKEAHMAKLGVDYLYIVEFTSAFANLSPQAFVDQYIVDLHAKVAIAGFDYTYGLRDVATMDKLPQFAQNRFEIISVAEQVEEKTKISSTRIRQAMDQGDVDEVNSLLGYTYETKGIVVHGDARGRTLGFPTANIQVADHVRLPKVGIYAVQIKVGTNWYYGMASIGYNVTFGAGRGMTVEVFILDFKQDIYGEQVTVKWHHYLRSEVKFSGVEALVTQLQQDQKNTETYFKLESSDTK